MASVQPQPLFIPETDFTPLVDFRGNGGVYRLVGSCFPDAPGVFFNDVINWARSVAETVSGQSLHLEVALDSFSTPSEAYLKEFFLALNAVARTNQVAVAWRDTEFADRMRYRAIALRELCPNISPFDIL